MPAVTTEDLHIAFRVVDLLQGRQIEDTVDAHLYAAAAELLRLEYRKRTRRNPIPGQIELDVATDAS